jgi:hypothetical protein
VTPSVLRRRLPAAVKRGARLLDQREPGWARKVKLTKLDLSNPCLCVLGQIYGRFSTGHYALGFAMADHVSHGFTLPDGLWIGGRDDWARLDVLWRDAIRQRRAR